MQIAIGLDNGIWVAQLREYDICAQGPDIATALHRLGLTIETESQEPGGVERIEPPPDKVWFELARQDDRCLRKLRGE